MPLLTLNLSCENVKYPARKHFEKTNMILDLCIGLFKMVLRWIWGISNVQIQSERGTNV